MEINIANITLPETNSSHLKMDGWKTSFLLGRPIFRARSVSGRVSHKTLQIFESLLLFSFTNDVMLLNKMVGSNICSFSSSNLTNAYV